MCELGITNEIIKPNDCVFAFGIPTSKSSFMNDPFIQEKDFTKVYFGETLHEYDWIKYSEIVLGNIEDIVTCFSKLKVTIFYDLTLNNFHDLFSNDFKVIILFSHWTETKIEFYDGLYGEREIIPIIPEDFIGFLDLCVCHPESLAIRIRELRPKCLTKYTRTKATPSMWLRFYETVFKCLNESDLPYQQALEKSVEIFVNDILS